MTTQAHSVSKMQQGDRALLKPPLALIEMYNQNTPFNIVTMSIISVTD